MSEPHPNDALLALLGGVRASAGRLRAALDDFGTVDASLERELQSGRSAPDVLMDLRSDLMARRRQVHQATRDFESAMQLFRGACIKAVVEEGGKTITEVSRMASISVQMARRLYRIANRAAGSP